MKKLTNDEYIKKLGRIRRNNLYRLRNKKLKEEKNRYRNTINFPPTSKLIAGYLFIILNIVLIFAMKAMWHFGDLSYLGVLITDVVAQILTYYIYARKALAENSAGGITYEIAMKNMNDDESSG